MVEWRAEMPAEERREAASGRSGRPAPEQAQEGGVSVGPGRKLGHVADALGKSDGGGPASEQGQKPLRRLPARVV